MVLITLVIVYQIIAITFALKEYLKIITYYPITLLPYYRITLLPYYPITLLP